MIARLGRLLRLLCISWVTPIGVIEVLYMAADPDQLGKELAVAEYQSLRTEIIKSIEIQFQLVGITVVAFGSITSIAFASRNPFVALIFPVVALILNVCFLNHVHSINRLATYTRAVEEQIVSSLGLSDQAVGGVIAGLPGWERFMSKTDRRAGWISMLDGYIFSITGFLAILTSLTIGRPHGFGIVIFVISCVIAVALVLLPIAWRNPVRFPS
jgi:hypothetical protein